VKTKDHTISNEASRAIPRRFDAIVLGSGLGGLIAGALCARAGQRVLVLERNGTLGGAATVDRHDGLSIESSLGAGSSALIQAAPPPCVSSRSAALSPCPAGLGRSRPSSARPHAARTRRRGGDLERSRRRLRPCSRTSIAIIGASWLRSVPLADHARADGILNRTSQARLFHERLKTRAGPAARER